MDKDQTRLTDEEYTAGLEALILAKFTDTMLGAGEDLEGPPVVRSLVVAAVVEQPTGETRGWWTAYGTSPYELIGLTRMVAQDVERAESCQVKHGEE